MDLTLVIPTYNRPDSLVRLLCVLRTFEYSGRILIADSSSDEIKQLNKRRASEWDAISHVEFPSDIAPFRKFSKSMALTETQLVMLLADDDMAFPDGLSECVSFLNANPTYSAAHGIYLNYTISDCGIRVPHIEYDSPSITADDPFDRLNSLLENYQALTYAVQRKECAVKAFENASKLDDILWQELTGGSITALEGPVKRLPIISHARQSGSTIGYRHWHPVEWLVRDAAGLFSGFSQYVRAIQNLAEQNVATTNLSSEKILDASNAAGLRYLAPYLENTRAVALMSHPADRTGEQKIAAAIDTWNDIHVKFPASLLLRYKPLGKLARVLKHNTLDRFVGSHRETTATLNGDRREIEIGKNVVRAVRRLEQKNGVTRLVQYFACYLQR